MVYLRSATWGQSMVLVYLYFPVVHTGGCIHTRRQINVVNSVWILLAFVMGLQISKGNTNSSSRRLDTL